MCKRLYVCISRYSSNGIFYFRRDRLDGFRRGALRDGVVDDSAEGNRKNKNPRAERSAYYIRRRMGKHRIDLSRMDGEAVQ